MLLNLPCVYIVQTSCIDSHAHCDDVRPNPVLLIGCNDLICFAHVKALQWYSILPNVPH